MEYDIKLRALRHFSLWSKQCAMILMQVFNRMDLTEFEVRNFPCSLSIRLAAWNKGHWPFYTKVDSDVWTVHLCAGIKCKVIFGSKLWQLGNHFIQKSCLVHLQQAGLGLPSGAGGENYYLWCQLLSGNSHRNFKFLEPLFHYFLYFPSVW